MVAFMIGLGPHEMTGWLWAYSIGWIVVFLALAIISYAVALCATVETSQAAQTLQPAQTLRTRSSTAFGVHADTPKEGPSS